MKRYWPVILLALLPLIPLWRAVFLGQAIGPFDQIQQMAPWNGPAPHQPWDVLQADGVLQFYPWRDLVFKAWSHGQLPLWNPYELAGTPLLANSQSAALYPPHVILGLLHFPTGLAITLLAWFHLFWAGLGTYLLTRRLGAIREGAAIAGASFQLSAFMISWTGLPSVITTVSWIPWALAFAWGMFHQPRSPARESALLAFSIGMMLLGGHLQFAAYGLMALAMLVVGLLAFRFKAVGIQPALFIVGACLLGFAVAAPQLLPVLKFSEYSSRKIDPTPDGYQAYASSAIQPFELLGVVYPKLSGDPGSNIPDIDAAPPYPAYWPQYVKRGANFAESAASIGPVVLLLLCFLPFARQKASALVPIGGVGLIGLLLALGTPLTWLTYFCLPGWSSTGSPGRAIVLFVLAACVFAGLGLREETASGKPDLKRFSPVGLFLALNLLLVIVMKSGLTTLTALYPDMRDSIGQIVQLSVREPLKVAMIVALLSAVVGALLVARNRQGRLAALVLASLVPALLVDGVLRFGDPSGLHVDGASSARVAIVNSAWDTTFAAPAFVPPNIGSLSGIHELAGYDSLVHRDSRKLLNDVDGGDAAPPANGNIVFVKPTATPSALADAGVTEIWTFTGAPSRSDWMIGQRGGTITKTPIEGPGRASTPSGKAEIIEETPTKLAVRATGPGKLVVRDRNMPGWLAKLDGQHVPLEGDLWREVELPAGEHRVEFNYVPPGFMPGVYLGFPAWLMLLAGFFLRNPKAESKT
jgi:hypothetical protein